MVEEYERFKPVYEYLRKLFPKFPIHVHKADILKQAESLGIRVEPAEEKSFFDGLEKYFHKFKITVSEVEIVKGKPVIRFEKMSEKEEKYEKFLDIYKTLGQILNKYIEKYGEYAIDINDIIIYANKIKPKDTEIPKEITGKFFLEGLEWYLSEKPDFYLPRESLRAGIEMEIKPLVSMETGDRKGNIAIFREIR